jgi:hypothetical protein
VYIAHNQIYAPLVVLNYKNTLFSPILFYLKNIKKGIIDMQGLIFESINNHCILFFNFTNNMKLWIVF